MRLPYNIAISLAFLSTLSAFMLGLGQDDYLLPSVMFLAACTSLYVTDFRRWIQLGDWTINVFILLLVFFTLGDIVRNRGEDLAISIARVLVFVQVILLFREKEPRHCWQILLISLLQVTVATVFQQSLVFAVLLLLYVFVGLWLFSLVFLRKESLYFQKHSFVNTFWESVREEMTTRQDHWKLARIALITLFTGPLSLLFSFGPTKNKPPSTNDAADDSEQRKKMSPEHGPQNTPPRQTIGLDILQVLFAVRRSENDLVKNDAGFWEVVKGPQFDDDANSWDKRLWSDSIEEEQEPHSEEHASAAGAKQFVPVPARKGRRKNSPSHLATALFPLLEERPSFSAGTLSQNGFQGRSRELYGHLIQSTFFAILLATALFLIIPRIGQFEFGPFSFGMGTWSANFNFPIATVGFREEVRLGSLATVLPQHREILSVRLWQCDKEQILSGYEWFDYRSDYTAIANHWLYFHGVALDLYENGIWKYGNSFQESLAQPVGGEPATEINAISNEESFFEYLRQHSGLSFSSRDTNPIDSFSGAGNMPALFPWQERLSYPLGRRLNPTEISDCFFQDDTDLVAMSLRIQHLDSRVFFAPWPFFRMYSENFENRYRIRLRFEGNRVEEFENREYPTRATIFTTCFRNGNQVDRVPVVDQVKMEQLLQMPASDLKALTDLAQKWDAASQLPKKNIAGRARFLEQQLLTSELFSYKLGGTVRDYHLDPLEDFVTKNPKGHCEFFAGALAMMLRSVGIGSRVVVGFKTLADNPGRNGYAVRQSDAHAWVEAYLPPEHVKEQFDSGYHERWKNGGWLRLDPTPAADDENFGTAMQISWTGLWETVNAFWQNYVLNMDSSKQDQFVYTPVKQTANALYEKLITPDFWRATLPNLWHHFRQLFQFRRGSGQWEIIDWLLAATMLCFLFGLAYIAKYWVKLFRALLRSRSAEARFRQITIEFYGKLERLLQQSWRKRRAEETPQEYVADSEFTGDAKPIVDAYYRVRYGAALLDENEINVIKDVLANIETKIKNG